MIELYISGWGEDFVAEGEVDEEAGTFTVLEDSLLDPPPMSRVVGDVVVNDFPISAIDRTPLGEPQAWCWVFRKAA